MYRARRNATNIHPTKTKSAKKTRKWINMNKHCVHQSHTKQYFCKSRPSTSRLNIKHVEALTTQSGSSFHTPHTTHSTITLFLTYLDYWAQSLATCSCSYRCFISWRFLIRPRLGKAAEQGWRNNGTDWRTPCRKFPAIRHWSRPTHFRGEGVFLGRLASYTQQLHSISVNHSPNPNHNPIPT